MRGPAPPDHTISVISVIEPMSIRREQLLPQYGLGTPVCLVVRISGRFVQQHQPAPAHERSAKRENTRRWPWLPKFSPSAGTGVPRVEAPPPSSSSLVLVLLIGLLPVTPTGPLLCRRAKREAMRSLGLRLLFLLFVVRYNLSIVRFRRVRLVFFSLSRNRKDAMSPHDARACSNPFLDGISPDGSRLEPTVPLNRTASCGMMVRAWRSRFREIGRDIDAVVKDLAGHDVGETGGGRTN